ncbi:unnamed protein product [Protopolystoma xenopodis]|uniref:KN17 SH3-like domain-containing protein n=1 Tax=Protopolystoma xenopodis TaxID=117903 RepID=A0A448WZ49_9PLAT|nr:unnamed protein product [Protopolystoma xenopodis]
MAELKAKAAKEKQRQGTSLVDPSAPNHSAYSISTNLGYAILPSAGSSLKPSSSTSISSATATERKRGALDELMAEEEALKEKRNRRDFWLLPGLEVKLINRKLPDDLQLRHAVVEKMVDRYTVSFCASASAA